DAEPAVGAHPAERLHVEGSAALGGGDLRLVLGRDDRPEVVAYLVAQRVLLGGQIDEHGGGGDDGARVAGKRAVAPSYRSSLSFTVGTGGTMPRNCGVCPSGRVPCRGRAP